MMPFMANILKEIIYDLTKLIVKREVLLKNTSMKKRLALDIEWGRCSETGSLLHHVTIPYMEVFSFDDYRKTVLARKAVT